MPSRAEAELVTARIAATTVAAISVNRFIEMSSNSHASCAAEIMAGRDDCSAQCGYQPAAHLLRKPNGSNGGGLAGTRAILVRRA